MGFGEVSRVCVYYKGEISKKDEYPFEINQLQFYICEICLLEAARPPT